MIPSPVSRFRGAQITISGPGGFDAATQTVGGTATETTGSDGLYQFLLLSGAPSGTYTLAITTYPGGYIPLTSALIPVCNNTITVASSPNPAEIQLTSTAPSASTANENPNACPSTTASFPSSDQSTTEYFYSFVINPATSANIINNHIPLDPLRFGILTITKTTPMVNVDIGQLVPYIITVHNTSSSIFPGVDIVDTLPAGFKYRSGTASLNGARLDPIASGRTLTWKNQSIAGNGTLTFKLMLVVGTGVQPGNYVNMAQAVSDFNQNALTNVATATVKVEPDPLFDCSEVIGKVFEDKKGTGYQEQGEPGIANVRLATVDGLLVTTDKYGRFHIACAAIPDPDRGSHFVMKVDIHSLPQGYYITTENPRDVLLTRGKMSKINFGAARLQKVRMEITDEAFDGSSIRLQDQWASQINDLITQLKARQSILRIVYSSSVENSDLAHRRLKAIEDLIKEKWDKAGHPYELTIEDELDQ